MSDRILCVAFLRSTDFPNDVCIFTFRESFTKTIKKRSGATSIVSSSQSYSAIFNAASENICAVRKYLSTGF